jgi:Histidine kinase-like ATPase domain
MAIWLVPPVASYAHGRMAYALVSCLHGPRPEHRARRLVACVLARAGITSGVDDAEAAVSELVTNARRHAVGPYELRIIVDHSAVKIAVMDGGADYVELAHRLLHAATGGAADGESGRGLQIVTGLFPGCCGAEPTSTCTGNTQAKQVWITLARPGVHGPDLASRPGADIPHPMPTPAESGGIRPGETYPGWALSALHAELAARSVPAVGATLCRRTWTLTLAGGLCVRCCGGWLVWPTGRLSSRGRPLHAMHSVHDAAGAAARLTQLTQSAGRQEGVREVDPESGPAP